ncbi:Ectoine hydroxylase-related dioxygenase, phytanoyl-CoA dioxygenase (PhyH) family [Roseateles sp. YR242]|uniref:phytanoyl-CoA dioxygenase family protein n=1 Tax=Roseateles sp. YR242 TaxID=1855305 RepID=UPI0008CA1712|nr:phytanoyl-CoA dioxygenase family protein [Roseateles sp. YR242]SEL52385.1 Ectoine hydroxylase-related dioxygenase, phytanoyl-CoA dioxygenase (PhyH) family [Roseateles sp. YR242]
MPDLDKAIKAARKEYDVNGFAILRNVLDSELIQEASAHVQWLQNRYPDLRPEHFHHPLMRDDAFWVRLVTDSRLMKIATAFLGDDVACFTSHYICKPPGDGQAVLWHQDAAYWSLQPMNALTIWVAIDDATPENGCLQMIPGSFRRGIEPLVMRDDVPNMLHSSVPQEAADESAAVSLVLNAGDVSIHHPNIIHGSGPNTSAQRRCGLDIGYIPVTTQIGRTGLYLNPLLVAGEDIHQVNPYRPWPMYSSESSMEFRGSAEWNTRAEAMNAQQVGAGSARAQKDVRQLTQDMMDRLMEGTTKQAR